jgi:hypothetical protein
MLADNNDFGLGLILILPLLFYQWHLATNRHLRHGLMVMGFLVTLAVFFTYSRGALVGVCAMGAVRRDAPGLATGVGAAAAFGSPWWKTSWCPGREAGSPSKGCSWAGWRGVGPAADIIGHPITSQLGHVDGAIAAIIGLNVVCSGRSAGCLRPPTRAATARSLSNGERTASAEHVSAERSRAEIDPQFPDRPPGQ